MASGSRHAFFQTFDAVVIIYMRDWGQNRQGIIRDIEKRFAERNAFQGSKCACYRH